MSNMEETISGKIFTDNWFYEYDD